MNRWWAWLLAASVLALAGCASTYTLDNTVQSFSQLAEAPAPSTYRFERLPSQQHIDHAALEALADPALYQAGFRRDDNNPRYSVQVSASVVRVLSPWADPWWNGWGWGYGYGRHYAFYGMWSGMDYPWYHREVNVIIRDLSSNRVVYETRAINDGPWRDQTYVLPAMFQAAMQGFPVPPPGPRVVNIQLAG
ncbi:hypothetical protein GCM10027034_38660 [Ramlibacter solisilvae]